MHCTSYTSGTRRARRISLRWSILVALLFPGLAMADAVSGRVYAPDGKLAPNMTFIAQPAKGPAVMFKTDASGNFSVYLDGGRFTVTSSTDATVEGTIESYPQPVQQDIHLKKREK